MPFVSITRLRVRSIRFLPFFAISTNRSLRQVKEATGFLGGGLLPDRDWAFWTMTVWDGEESMRRFMTSGSHRVAMPKLMDWCDEASVAHWEQADDALPSWTEADQRMRACGRASKVRHPSARHASLTYRTPRVSTGVPILPVSKPL
jgi:heme-degrading monooxygenase HmoA